MNETRYIVRFKRADGATPDVEEYYYWTKADAKMHLNMFKEDNPDFPLMYESIQLIEKNNKEESILDELKFK